jgi:hypothetical protein
MLINSKQTIGWLTKKKSNLLGPDVLLHGMNGPGGYASIRVEEQITFVGDLIEVFEAVTESHLVTDELSLIDT